MNLNPSADTSPEENTSPQRHFTRFVTATSLFDGHDASINIIRRLLQREGAEVIHLGHNRSVDEVIITALQEDAQGIAISSYQGGHNEYFQYLVDMLKEYGSSHIKIFGGGGGVIVAEEIEALQKYGVSKIFSPYDGQKYGLEGMAKLMLDQCQQRPEVDPDKLLEVLSQEKLSKRNDERGYNIKYTIALARLLTLIENESENEKYSKTLYDSIKKFQQVKKPCPVIGFTGSGGAGKSSTIDEFIRRFTMQNPKLNLALISVDPTQRKTGGALLGDRLRMNSVNQPRVFMRSMATRNDHESLSRCIGSAVDLLRFADFDLILVESSGIGQSDTRMSDIADFVLYIMTNEYGADTQLEKIAMFDYADMILVNKFDRPKSEDALKAVKKQYRRARNLFHSPEEDIPVYGTIASNFNDSLTNAAFAAFMRLVNRKCHANFQENPLNRQQSMLPMKLLGNGRERYLAEIAQVIYEYKQKVTAQKENLNLAQHFFAALQILHKEKLMPFQPIELKQAQDQSLITLIEKYNHILSQIEGPDLASLAEFDNLKSQYDKDFFEYTIRQKKISVKNFTVSLSHNKIPKVIMPEISSWGDRFQFLKLENVPGSFPYTAGVFPFKREGEDPTRMFAGEGNPERTNRRFHYISQGQLASRLSTAFDSVTLYGEDPHQRPDIYGKIGNAGVSICTVDDMKKLYSGFRLTSEKTSVSMTINGPAPTILAFYFLAAIDQEVEIYLRQNQLWQEADEKITRHFTSRGLYRPKYQGDLPPGNDGLGLGLLGISGSTLLPPEKYQQIKAETLKKIRGTVQADILKEDQAQNTCIFSTEFSLKMMGDIQQYFIDHDIENFYSVSISGYHIAEAGANPITQVAFTLANGFTYLEYYRNRGMDVNKFAKNLSFFFSNGMDPEYAVIGRVARRIWSIALKNKYHSDERAQKLKYHIQTSGRSLHAQEISFNDIRTTLQALYAISDNCNSLHTNAYDEAVTTPTPESVRRAIAIQLIINRELGLTKNENPLQGSYFVSFLTDLVENEILKEFERIAERGGVLGAMETMYQRRKIQEESLYYEQLKQTGEYPIVGVNTYLNEGGEENSSVELMRSTENEKQLQLKNLEQFQRNHEAEKLPSLQKLKDAALTNSNLFEQLLETAKHCSLGEITATLYEVGGAYRRNM